MNRHTPGPWRAIGDNIRSDHHADGTGALLLTAGTMFHNYTPNRDEEQANLRLAAAAPTLLAAANAVLCWYEETITRPYELRPPGQNTLMSALHDAIAAASGKEKQ